MRGFTKVYLLVASVGITITVAGTFGQALPCIEEYQDSSCTLFLPDPLPAECPPEILAEGTCVQTRHAATGLTTQDTPFDGPNCRVAYLKPDPNNPGQCIQQSGYEGPGKCRTASGTACPGQHPQ